jgi:hypothetical protein
MRANDRHPPPLVSDLAVPAAASAIWQGLGWLIAAGFVMYIISGAHTPRWVHGNPADLLKAGEGLLVLGMIAAFFVGLKYLDQFDAAGFGERLGERIAQMFSKRGD